MQNVLEMVVLGESAARKITHSLTYYSQSDHIYAIDYGQTKCGKCTNSAIFQMTIFITEACVGGHGYIVVCQSVESCAVLDLYTSYTLYSYTP